MSFWPVMALLLAITGFYVFLSVYLVFHLLSGYVLGTKRNQQKLGSS